MIYRLIQISHEKYINVIYYSPQVGWFFSAMNRRPVQSNFVYFERIV